MLKLNKIQEEQAREHLQWARGLLEELRAAPLPNTDHAQQKYHENLGTQALQVGLFAYALEYDDSEVIQLLSQAAHHLARSLTLRMPTDPDTSRNPWQTEKFLNVIACFGNPADQSAMVALQVHQLCNPIRPHHEPLLQYLLAVRAGFSEAPFDAAAFSAVVKACDSPQASKDQRLFLLPAARGLLAVATENEDDWNYALAQILTSHGREARRGDLKLLADGFISLRALMLAKWGMDQGLSCHADSEYLPLHLLAENAE
jgi:hypothetical protein